MFLNTHMAAEYVVLRIDSHSEVPLAVIRQFLNNLESAYNNIYFVTELLLSSASNSKILVGDILERRPSVARLIRPNDRMILRGVELQSPGHWAFLGKLIPFETIRTYLNDRHERRKDKNYREAAEERKLHLENELLQTAVERADTARDRERAMIPEDVRQAQLQNANLETEVLRGRIAAAKEMGASEEQLSKILDSFVLQPLKRLDRFDNQGLIGHVTIEDAEKRQEKE